MSLTHWTRHDLNDLTTLALLVAHEKQFYCANCQIRLVRSLWEYCSGCVEEIVEYLEKDNRRYLRAIALKEGSFHFEG